MTRQLWLAPMVLVLALGGLAPLSARGEVDEIVGRIDALILRNLQQQDVKAAGPASDAEFLRRAWVDLAGVIPPVAGTREFLDDSSPDKRERLIDRLLSSPATINHLSEVWRNAMLPAVTPELLGNSAGLQEWLRTQFEDNLRYDRVVSDLIAATGTEQDGPALFYTALGLEPKKIAAATARIFLGLQIECAECHNHPFDDWSQRDFWAYTAFFARMPDVDMRNRADFRLDDRASGEVTLPDTEDVVLPKFPGGRAPDADEHGSRRQQLSIWMASPENPYVARAAVNRVWALLFGRGLVDPVDDLGPHNPASHPELLELLTDYFVDSGFDLKMLLKTLCSTEAYGRTSQIDPAARPPAELFAAMGVKVFTAEQLFDSLNTCLSQNSEPSPQNPAFGNGRRQMFLARMARRTADAMEYDRGLQQALQLMNGEETAEATDLQRSALLTSLEAPFLSQEQRIEILFLATLTRFPRQEELTRMMRFVEAAKSADRSEQTAYADMLWALLNSAEFTVNH